MKANEQLATKSSPKHKGFKRIVAATKYSFHGLKLAAQTESAFKQELIASLVLIPLAIWLGDSSIEQSLLISSVVFVMIVELLNTAVEAVVDRVSPDFHELSRQAKDLGSAAVFLSISLASLVWVLLLSN
jgi:diacylglycerol kinase (ATP)